jgi:cysteinyl-tRNA synthetase
MNFTDVDDKTIRRSAERYPEDAPEEALRKLTDEYGRIFLDDMRAIGNDTETLEFVKATGTIAQMQALIRRLFDGGFAYIADDGVYFSIDKYKASGKTYGQLLTLTAGNTSEARIDNDEYDKESVHDFALWKLHKDGEPAWDFELDGRQLAGRPGWHIECSAMSEDALGQPFDIHTGGVDLIFPHHENEIAQSTAGQDDPVYAKWFVHNEHLLVDGRKMSKSLGNFFTLRDVQERGFDPLAFRLLVLQSHYRSQSNFSWDNLEAAQNRLQTLREFADLQFQPLGSGAWVDKTASSVLNDLQEHLNTPGALAALSNYADLANEKLISPQDREAFAGFLKVLDEVFGLGLASRSDITDEQKQLIQDRAGAKDTKDWEKADSLRDELKEQRIGLRDTDRGQIWYRL